MSKFGSLQMVNVPNVLTFGRIFMIPLFVIAFYLPFKFGGFICAGIFSAACLTDWLDGYLARKLNQLSKFGEFLDPVADKLIVASALVLLAQDFGTMWMTLPAIVIVGREIVISALREWMAELGKRTNLSVSKLGKWKTAVQMIAIIMLLSQPSDWTNPIVLSGVVLIYCAVALTLWSMIAYLRAAWISLK